MTTQNRDCNEQISAGPPDARVAIVGELGAGETTPFSSDAGQRFLELAGEAKLPIQKSRLQVAASGFSRLLEDAGVKWVVLVGDEALHEYRPDLDQRFAHGRMLLLQPQDPDGGMIGLPVFHHEAIDRCPKFRALVYEELSMLRQLALKRTDWPRFLSDTCVRCRGEFKRIDPNGVVYCEAHSEP